MFEGKKCLVTGATGLLGSHIKNQLRREGAKVYVQSLHGCFPIEDQLKTSVDLVETTGEFLWYQFPLDIEYIFHCAAVTGGATIINDHPDILVTANNRINMNLLEATSYMKSLKKFVFISSTAVYPPSMSPFKESEGFEGNPDDKFFGPGWMKRYGEKLVEFYHRLNGFDAVIIRPSNVYGEFCNFDPKHSHVIPALIRRIVSRENPLKVWGSPNVERDFIYGEDFAKGVLQATESTRGFDVFNIAKGESVTIGQTVEALAELINYKGTIEFDTSKPTTKLIQRVSNLKARVCFGFTAPTTFREGLRRTIDWYISQSVREEMKDESRV